MKKFLIAAAATLLIFGGQPAEASSVDNLDTPNVETQETGKWSHFRDKYILNRETENERNDRREWERRQRERERYRDDHRYEPPPPPPRHGDRYGNPPPPPRHGDRYGNPPPRYR